MHQQMLARYDAERLSAGVTPVERSRTTGRRSRTASTPVCPTSWSRPDGAVIADVAACNYTVARTTSPSRDGIRTRRAPGRSGGDADRPRTCSGSTIEASIGSVADRARPLPQPRSRAHLRLGSAPRDSGRPGAMWSTATAIMDPVFFRWHRHVDDLGTGWQEQPAGRTTSPTRRRRGRHAAAPATSRRHGCPLDAVPGGSAPASTGRVGRRVRRSAWCASPSDAGAGSGCAADLVARRRPGGAGRAASNYLDHDDFVWVLGPENTRG